MFSESAGHWNGASLLGISSRMWRPPTTLSTLHHGFAFACHCWLQGAVLQAGSRRQPDRLAILNEPRTVGAMA